MKRPFMTHQEWAFDYARTMTHPALLMEMRLGKTLVYIRWAQEQIASGPILVVAPRTVLTAWIRELGLEGENYILARGDREARLSALSTAFNWRGRVWILTNYESLKGCPEYLVQQWPAVVLDESTKIKNPKSQISELCTYGLRLAERRSILTGLIRPENDIEVFQQMKFLDGQFMGCDNYWKFRNKYFEQDFDGRGWSPKYGISSEIKAKVHARCFVLRRADAGLEGRKIYSTRSVPMNAAQARMVKMINKEWAYKDSNGDLVETEIPAVKYGWQMRIAGGFNPDGVAMISDAKIKALLEVIGEFPPGEQFVVWFKYRSELHSVEDALKNKGFKIDKIWSGVGDEERSQVIEAFRNRKFQILLATEKCGKFGIDCSTASCAIYYSNEMSNEDRVQSEDRIYNATMNNALYCIDLMTEGSIEEEAIPKLQEKTFDSHWFNTHVSSFDEVIK